MTTYRSKASKLVDSLINYTLDVKPYHTKLKQFVSELYFSDTVTVSFIAEDFNPIIYLQNVWTKSDVGALYLQNLAEGIERDRHLPLPPAAYPRFSLNSFLNYGQTPPGDDPASQSFLDVNTNGVPDGEEPWVAPPDPQYIGAPSLSHQVGVTDEVPARLKAGFANIVSVISSANIGGGYFYTALVDVPVDTNWAGLFGIPTTNLTLVVNGQSFYATEITPGIWRAGISGFFKYDTAFGDDSTALLAFIETVKVQAFATVDTGRYKVPFHHGSFVTVNGVQQTFSVDYVVDHTRGFIQFLAGKHPALDDVIAINYFNSDRVFISLQDPLNFGEAGYDVTPYEQVSYDFPDDAFDSWTLLVDSNTTDGYVVSFLNSEPGTTKAYIGEVLIYPSQTDGSQWQIVADGFQSVTVQQIFPIVGPIEHAVINIRFDNGKIAFTLKNTWLDYYFVQDSDSYIAYDVSMLDLEQYGEPLDAADFWPSLELRTEHGVVTDPLPPLHDPVLFTGIFQTSEVAGYDMVPYELEEYDSDGNVSEYIRPLGVIRQVLVDTLQGPKPTYEFYLDSIPPRGTYIEVRLEQARQYNPRVNVSITEAFAFIEVASITSNSNQGQLLGAGILGAGLLGHGAFIGGGGPPPSGAQPSVLGANILGSSLVD